MDETNQVWQSKYSQTLIERLTETLIQLQKNQSALCRGLEETQIILNKMKTLIEE